MNNWIDRVDKSNRCTMMSYNSHGRSKNIKNSNIKLTILNGNANNISNQNNNATKATKLLKTTTKTVIRIIIQ